MQTRFNDFVQEAVEEGRMDMRRPDGSAPLLVAEGSEQDSLITKVIDYFQAQDFYLMDFRDGSAGQAVASFTLPWRRLYDRLPRPADFLAPAGDPHHRLLIVCGLNDETTFWRYLCDERVLHSGGVFPPSQSSSERCYVVPNAALILAVVKETDLQAIRHRDYFWRIFRFNSW